MHNIDVILAEKLINYFFCALPIIIIVILLDFSGKVKTHDYKKWKAIKGNINITDETLKKNLHSFIQKQNILLIDNKNGVLVLKKMPSFATPSLFFVIEHSPENGNVTIYYKTLYGFFKAEQYAQNALLSLTLF